MFWMNPFYQQLKKKKNNLEFLIQEMMLMENFGWRNEGILKLNKFEIERT